MEYYSNIKGNELLTHTTIGNNLKIIKLSKRNQTKKKNTYCICLNLCSIPENIVQPIVT